MSASNDAAQVRDEDRRCPNCDSPWMEGTGLYVCGEGIRGNVAGGCREYYTAKLIRGLAATAEKADELQRFYDERIDLWHCTMEDKAAMDENLRRVEAALLAAQQERDAVRAQRKLDIKHFKERAERAEATNTRLRESMRAADDVLAGMWSFSDESRANLAHTWTVQASDVLRLALAQDTEQESGAVCEVCGEPATQHDETQSAGGWHWWCDEHSPDAEQEKRGDRRSLADVFDGTQEQAEAYSPDAEQENG